MTKKIKGIANIFKTSSYMFAKSSYIEPEHRQLAKKMYNGEIPANVNDITFKGEDFQNFIIDAVKEVNVTMPVVVRLEGNNAERGAKILSDSGLKLIPADGLADAANKVVKSLG